MLVTGAIFLDVGTNRQVQPNAHRQSTRDPTYCNARKALRRLLGGKLQSVSGRPRRGWNRRGRRSHLTVVTAGAANVLVKLKARKGSSEP